MALTREDSTEYAYRRRAANDLIPRCALRAGKEAEQVTIDDARGWLEEMRRFYTPNTFRQYRNALAFHFESRGEDATRLRSLAQGPERVKPRHGQTSSGKQKKIPVKRAVRIIKALRETNRKWELLAADLFEGSIRCGLRPIEWEDAMVIDDLLIIQNAKATNGRGNGKERTIHLTPEDEEVALRIASAIRQVPAGINWLACARAAFYETRVTLYPKTIYTLYTARHQFSANMKAQFSREMVADLMGHKTTRTAAVHYGKRRSAWRRLAALTP
jgi:hypothetical protein